MSGWGWAAVGTAILVLAVLLRRPAKALFRILLRSGLGMAFLWLFQGVGGLLGVQLGVNPVNGLVLGLLGVPGLALLMMVRWVTGTP